MSLLKGQIVNFDISNKLNENQIFLTKSFDP